MPILATQENIDELRKMENNHVCAVCGAFLKIERLTGSRDYYLKCSQFEKHEGIKRIVYNAGDINFLRLLKGEPQIMETTALQKLDEKAMLERVNKAKWPADLKPEDKQIIVKVATEYGLDPLFGELMVYQGRPYVTIDARRRKAQETHLLDGVSSRPATAEERTARQVPEGDYLFYCEVWVKGASHPFIGWGQVRKSETKGNEHLPIVKDPMFMAEKRSEAQALRRAFHIPLPSAEEIIEGEFIDVTPPKSGPDKKKPAAAIKNGYDASGNGDRLTQAQINKIWTTANLQGWKASEVNDYVLVKFEVKSVGNLSVAQADKLIKAIEAGEGLTADEVASIKR